MRGTQQHQSTRVFRSKRNAHRYFYFLEGKLRQFTTQKDDFMANVAELFGKLNGWLTLNGATARTALLSAALLTGFFANLEANALPTGATSVEGGVTFTQTGNTLDVNTAAARAIAEYNSFNVGAAETVNFNLPNQDAAILNRVVGPDASQIMGKINSNGQVYLVNPAGVFFGAGSQVNVASLFASTLNIPNADFVNDNLQFSNTAPGAVENSGTITVANGGYAVLAGGSVKNAGAINALKGRVELAVGQKVSLSVSNNVLLNLTVDEDLVNAVSGKNTAISNTGTISANGGQVNAQARFVNGLYQYAVNNENIVEARTVDDLAGAVQFSSNAGNNAIISNRGAVDVSGTATGENAGTVVFNADKVGHYNQILASGSGSGSGGSVFLLANKSLDVIANSQTLANSTGLTGNGGTVVLTGDLIQVFQNAQLNVSGGSSAGTGGVISLSGSRVAFSGQAFGSGVDSAGSFLASARNFTLGRASAVPPTPAILINGFGTIQVDASQDINIYNDVQMNYNGPGLATALFNADNNFYSVARVESTNTNLNIVADRDGGNNGRLIVTYDAPTDGIYSNGQSIFLQAAAMTLFGPISAGSTGNITILPSTNKQIIVGGIDPSSDTYLALSISDMELDNLEAGSVFIGELTNPSNMYVVSDIAATGTGFGNYNLNLLTGGHLYSINNHIDQGNYQFNITALGALKMTSHEDIALNNVSALAVDVTAKDKVLFSGDLTSTNGWVNLIADSDFWGGGNVAVMGTLAPTINKDVNLQGNKVYFANGINAGTGTVDIRITGTKGSDQTSKIQGDIIAGRINMKGDVAEANLRVEGDLIGNNGVFGSFDGGIWVRGDVVANNGGIRLLADQNNSQGGSLAVTGSQVFAGNGDIELEGATLHSDATDITAAGTGDVFIRATGSKPSSDWSFLNGNITGDTVIINAYQSGMNIQGDVTANRLSGVTEGSLVINGAVSAANHLVLIADSNAFDGGALGVFGPISTVNGNVKLYGSHVHILSTVTATGDVKILATGNDLSSRPGYISGDVSGNNVTLLGFKDASLVIDGSVTATGQLTGATDASLHIFGAVEAPNAPISLVADQDNANGGDLVVALGILPTNDQNITVQGSGLYIGGALDAGLGDVSLTATGSDAFLMGPRTAQILGTISGDEISLFGFNGSTLVSGSISGNSVNQTGF